MKKKVWAISYPFSGKKIIFVENDAKQNIM